MSNQSSKNTGLTLLVVGGIFLFILSCMHAFEWFGFDLWTDYLGWRFSSLISVGLEFLSSLLILIGFVMFHGETRVQSISARFCPKCRKQIPGDAQFCPFCGWQAEAQ